MRSFSYITIGKILNELRAEGAPDLQRITLYRFIRKWKLPGWDNRPGEWRRFSVEEANQVKDKLKTEYKITGKGNFVVRFIGGLR